MLIRSFLIAALFSLPFATSASAQSRGCQAHYQATFTTTEQGQRTAVFGGNPFANQRPGEFAVRIGCGASTANRCRRRAADRAHDCMAQHFGQWDRNNPPAFPLSAEPSDRRNACRTNMFGYDVASFGGSLGFAACLTPDGFPAWGFTPTVRRVEVSAKTHGQSGCAVTSNGNTRTRVLAENVVVDCAYRAARSGASWRNSRSTGFDRPGGDMAAVAAQTPDACAVACRDRNGCRAWTFVTNTQGIPGIDANRRCFLKNTIPHAVANNCCTSGTMGFNIELRTDRPGADMPGMPVTVRHRFGCQTRCELTQGCRAWTYVEGQDACFLKTAQPAPRRQRNCCSSGVVN
ncbi:MAG: PAN domain-containing protein [Pseudomonadota bacterium]